MFGRGGEEIEGLAAEGIPFQVVPGVTSASGAATYAGIPLTHRDHAQACVFITGHGRDGDVDVDWKLLLQPHQTVAIYMGLTRLAELAAQFVVRGADPAMPVAVIENGTRPDQRVLTGTLATIAQEAAAMDIKGPAMIVIGTVVTLRAKLSASAS
jgi:uroporphyrin-III C-methyltransferase/precorrin-2 dehydrogenase/sirohydrochlorin ferrochelatase